MYVKPTNVGKAWVVYETHNHELTNYLVSIIRPTRPYRWVAGYLQQLHVDRFWTIEDKIAFKKSPNSGPTLLFGHLKESIIVNSDTSVVLSAVKADRITLQESEIEIEHIRAEGVPPNLSRERVTIRVSLRERA